jgi:DNA-binding NarL/FixJ family response regulator
MEVLELLAQDLSNAEIGRRLCVSARTVEHHVTAILARLGLGSRGEAAERARAAGWLAQDGGGAGPR